MESDLAETSPPADLAFVSDRVRRRNRNEPPAQRTAASSSRPRWSGRAYARRSAWPDWAIAGAADPRQERTDRQPNAGSATRQVPPERLDLKVDAVVPRVGEGARPVEEFRVRDARPKGGDPSFTGLRSRAARSAALRRRRPWRVKTTSKRGLMSFRKACSLGPPSQLRHDPLHEAVEERNRERRVAMGRAEDHPLCDQRVASWRDGRDLLVEHLGDVA